eukprot:TRINITY_DN74300_c0_g1_i2.p1 TRINITY_DN74300_c0_g1~~TRINITY_DN74300_c0_g1_i2.p1  ORF type:complete len:137 (+),score=19.43 TRINITY_DN74300_c0_g1_i2:53-412(+)
MPRGESDLVRSTATPTVTKSSTSVAPPALSRNSNAPVVAHRPLIHAKDDPGHGSTGRALQALQTKGGYGVDLGGESSYSEVTVLYLGGVARAIPAPSRLPAWAAMSAQVYQKKQPQATA